MSRCLISLALTNHQKINGFEIKHPRMVASGKIEKLSKGKYYKPQSTVFGNLLLEQNQIVKDLLEKNGNLLGYITGYSYYNAIGFRTQVSNVIQIAKNETRPLQRGRFNVSFIKQKTPSQSKMFHYSGC